MSKTSLPALPPTRNIVTTTLPEVKTVERTVARLARLERKMPGAVIWVGEELVRESVRFEFRSGGRTANAHRNPASKGPVACGDPFRYSGRDRHATQPVDGQQST